MKVILQGLVILALSLAPAYGQFSSALTQNVEDNTNSEPAIGADQAGGIQEAEMRFPVLRTVGGLGLVVCLMIAVYFAAKKFAPRYFAKSASERNLRVIETLAMGDKRSISLIEVADSRFLVGNTPHQINLLAALPEPASFISEAETLSVNPKDSFGNESKASFRNLFEVEKKRPSQRGGNPLPDDIRTKMRQLREALER